jgi:hypothetical protein
VEKKVPAAQRCSNGMSGWRRRRFLRYRAAAMECPCGEGDGSCGTELQQWNVRVEKETVPAAQSCSNGMSVWRRRRFLRHRGAATECPCGEGDGIQVGEIGSLVAGIIRNYTMLASSLTSL